MSLLTLYCDDTQVAQHVLMRAVVALGRHPDNDIVLDDLALSRFHSRIERRGDRYVVVDLGSQNGVFLNGVRVSGEAVIRPGDRIGMGRYVGVFNQGAERRVRSPRRVSEAPTQKARRHGGVPHLRLLHNGKEIDRYDLNPDGVLIGRSQRCDVVIGLLALSRRHARVRQGSDGIWYVEDLGSQNGTYLNDQPVTAPTQLSNGDNLNFFEYSLCFEGAMDSAVLEQPEVPLSAQTRELRKTRPRTAAAKNVDLWEERNVVSEVIELSQEDVEELDFDELLAPASITNPASIADPVNSPDESTDNRDSRAIRAWPNAAETGVALLASQKPASSGRIEVIVDGKVVTEVPLALGAVRAGSDARCDVALPPLPGISPWHVLIIAIGEAVLMMRIGDSPAPRINDRVVYQCFLQPGDRINLGRASLIYRG